MCDVQLTEEEVGLTEQDVQLKPRGISAFQTRVTPKLGSPSTPIHVAPFSFKQETGSLKHRLHWWLYNVTFPDK